MFSNLFRILLAIIAIQLSIAAEAQYPTTELREHQQLHGNIEAVSEKDITIILERAILTLDLIDTNPSNRAAHIEAYSTFLLPKLQNEIWANDSINSMISSSLDFRFERIRYPLIVLPGPGGGDSGSAAMREYQNPTVTSVPDCEEFDSGFSNYCKDPAFQTFIVAEVNGGGSTHYSTLEQFMRTADWSAYKSQEELDSALLAAGIEQQQISSFSQDFLEESTETNLLNKFNIEEPLINLNPDFYILQNLKDIQIQQQIPIGGVQLR